LGDGVGDEVALLAVGLEAGLDCAAGWQAVASSSAASEGATTRTNLISPMSQIIPQERKQILNRD
jgi:hypothetical protein